MQPESGRRVTRLQEAAAHTATGRKNRSMTAPVSYPKETMYPNGKTLQKVLEAEMMELLGEAAPDERGGTRSGYRAGCYGRGLVTRIGKLELRVLRDLQFNVSTGSISTDTDRGTGGGTPLCPSCPDPRRPTPY
jgi:hypothetical protein